MTLESLGNLGEFVSSIAVLISLVYLAIQIKRSTDTERTSTYQSIVSDFGRMNESIAGEPGLALLYVRAMEDFEALDPAERARISQIFFQTFRYFENMFYQHRKGFLDDEIWIGWKRLMLTYFARKGFHAWWQMRRDIFSDPFVQALESGRLDRPVPAYAEIANFDPSQTGDTPR